MRTGLLTKRAGLRAGLINESVMCEVKMELAGSEAFVVYVF